ncbi:hypothetical protein HDU97_009912 [Phlyctochytrium planicorne]|nr:hypothetical protein HDU97_009912 [Phlyctochytrium planicorne]
MADGDGHKIPQAPSFRNYNALKSLTLPHSAKKLNLIQQPGGKRQERGGEATSQKRPPLKEVAGIPPLSKKIKQDGLKAATLFFHMSVEKPKLALLQSKSSEHGATIANFFAKTVTHVVASEAVASRDAPSSSKKRNDTILEKAKEWNISVISVKTLERKLESLGRGGLDKPRNPLADCLRQEKIYGLSTARGHDDVNKLNFIPFEGHYILVEDLSGQYRPLVLVDFHAAKPAWEIPRLFLTPKPFGASPFALPSCTGDDEVTHNEKENAPINLVLSRPLQSSYNLSLGKPNMHSTLDSQRNRLSISLAEQQMKIQLGKKILGKPLLRQKALEEKAKVGDGDERSRKRKRDAEEYMPVKSRRPLKKGGYCENCDVQFDCYEEHVKTEPHMKWELEDGNFEIIDKLRKKIQRPPAAIKPKPSNLCSKVLQTPILTTKFQTKDIGDESSEDDIDIVDVAPEDNVAADGFQTPLPNVQKQTLETCATSRPQNLETPMFSHSNLEKPDISAFITTEEPKLYLNPSSQALIGNEPLSTFERYLGIAPPIRSIDSCLTTEPLHSSATLVHNCLENVLLSEDLRKDPPLKDQALPRAHRLSVHANACEEFRETPHSKAWTIEDPRVVSSVLEQKHFDQIVPSVLKSVPDFIDLGINLDENSQEESVDQHLKTQGCFQSSFPNVQAPTSPKNQSRIFSDSSYLPASNCSVQVDAKREFLWNVASAPPHRTLEDVIGNFAEADKLAPHHREILEEFWCNPHSKRVGRRVIPIKTVSETVENDIITRKFLLLDIEFGETGERTYVKKVEVYTKKNKTQHLTGYDQIEERKNVVAAKDLELHQKRDALQKAKYTYENSIDERRKCQREINSLLQVSMLTDSDTDVVRFTELYRKDLGLEQSENVAKQSYRQASEDFERIHLDFLK